MKSIKLLLSVAFLLFVIGCKPSNDPQSYIVDGQTLIQCVSKLSGEPSILYYLKDATQYEPEHLPVIITYITDVNGNKLSLNNYEMENYNCREIKKAD